MSVSSLGHYSSGKTTNDERLLHRSYVSFYSNGAPWSLGPILLVQAAGWVTPTQRKVGHGAWFPVILDCFTLWWSVCSRSFWNRGPSLTLGLISYLWTCLPPEIYYSRYFLRQPRPSVCSLNHLVDMAQGPAGPPVPSSEGSELHPLPPGPLLKGHLGPCTLMTNAVLRPESPALVIGLYLLNAKGRLIIKQQEFFSSKCMNCPFIILFLCTE